jgi:uroporphyrinogen decarboxylase
MSPVDRIYRTMEGKPVDRVPVFCAMMESRAANEVLGKPLISNEAMMKLPVSRFLLDRWGAPLTPIFFRPTLARTLHRRNRGQVELGFDAIWMYYDDSWILLDHDTIAFTTGSIYKLMPDGYGDMTYMYQKPAITAPEDFDAWPYWPDEDAIAHRVYRYFKKGVKEFGDRTCVFGNCFLGGFQETMNWTFGIDRVPVWIKRHPEYVMRFLDMMESLWTKLDTALLDAGVPVILHTDDFAFKTGPFMSPKMASEIFGPRYRKLVKMAHDRGAKIVLHSCGDNTRLFDLFIDWGFDGLHAYETTSNVDIFNEKKIHGDRVTIIGGVGVDYLLTERSRDEEVVERTKELIRELGPGGRYILSPVHSTDSMPAHKLRVMLDAAREHGRYPINVK